jgi:hypothetical protein
MAPRTKIAAFAIGGYLTLFALDALVSLILPKPAILAGQDALSSQLLQQDVSFEQWAAAAERLEQKRKLAKL